MSKDQSVVKDLIVFGLLVFGGVFFVLRFWSIFFPLALAIIIAYLLNPIIGKLQRRFDLERIWVILMVYLIFFGIVIVSSYSLIPKVAKEFSSIQENLPNYFSFFQTTIDNTQAQIQTIFPSVDMSKVDIMTRFNQNMQKHLLALAINIPAIVQGMLSVLMILVLVPFITFFLLKDGIVLKKLVYDLIPNRYYEAYRNLAYRMDQQLGNYIRGQVLDAIIIGLLSTVGLGIIGVKYFFIIGILAGVSNLIPYFGPFMGALPAILVTIVEKGLVWQDILMICFVLFGVVQMIDNLFVQPLVVGNSVNLHPLIVMFAIMIGGSFGGLFAMLLVVPFVSVLRIVIIELFAEYKYRKFLKFSESG